MSAARRSDVSGTSTPAGPATDPMAAGMRAADALLQPSLQRQGAQRERIARWRERGERAFGTLAAIGVFAAALGYGPAWGLSVPWNVLLGVVLGTLVGSFWPERRAP
jgi:hypothetical protein